MMARPRTHDTARDIKVWLSRDIVCALDTYAHAHGLSNRTEALRAVITTVCPPVAVTWEPGKYVRGDLTHLMAIVPPGRAFSKRDVMRRSNRFMAEPERCDAALAEAVTRGRLEPFPPRGSFQRWIKPVKK